MTQPSFYWHDYETWGANPRIDRPAQFAGIRTDMDLNIVGEPLMIYAQPTADFLPSPEAVLITGITPQKALQEGVIEAEFFKAILKELSQAGTCVVGYNSIRFDEEVTRFGLYRNFYDPYAYSWQNGNSRWDVLDLMRLAHALRPEGIHWPLREDGTPSFKLTDLTEANQIEQQGAHDALVDVRATIDMARLVKQAQPKLFDFYFALRHKQRVSDMLDVSNPQMLLHVSGMFPAHLGCLAPIVPLMPHPVNSNEIICYNLRVDPAPLLQLDADSIREKLYTRSQDLQQGEERLALKGVVLNKSPALAPLGTLDDAMAEKWQVDLTRAQHYMDQLLDDPGLIDKLKQVYSVSRPFEEADIDAALYDGFIPNADRVVCQQLLDTPAEALSEWDGSRFSDPRLQKLMFRYRARNYPNYLNEHELEQWRQFCQGRLIDGDYGASLTLEQFQQQLLTLVQQSQEERDQKLLDALSRYVQSLF